jgi:beta-glucuronidase
VREADIYDSHDYDQNPATFKARHDALLEGQPYLNLCGGNRAQSVPWGGQPYFVSEFGGIWWNPDVRAGEASWGYGNRPTSAEEFHTRFDGLCAALLANPAMFAYCYTQLTDVYQEQNGIYRFDRSSKLDVERVRAAQVRPAAVETRR